MNRLKVWRMVRFPCHVPKSTAVNLNATKRIGMVCPIGSRMISRHAMSPIPAPIPKAGNKRHFSEERHAMKKAVKKTVDDMDMEELSKLAEDFVARSLKDLLEFPETKPNALESLDALREKGVTISEGVYNDHLDLENYSFQNEDELIQILQEMESLGYHLSKKSASALVSAHVYSSPGEIAPLQIWNSVRSAKVNPSNEFWGLLACSLYKSAHLREVLQISPHLTEINRRVPEDVYNMSIASLGRLEKPQEAFNMFMHMQMEGVKPSIRTYQCILAALLTNQKTIEALKRASFFNNLGEYLPLRTLARLVHPGKKVMTRAWSLYQDMKNCKEYKNEGAPSSLLTALSGMFYLDGDTDRVCEVLRDVQESEQDFEDVYIFAFRSLSEDGRIHEAIRVKDEFEETGIPITLDAYACFIHGFMLNLEYYRALEVFNEMRTSDQFSMSMVPANLFNLAILCHLRMETIEDRIGFKLFQEMDELKVKKSIASYVFTFQYCKTMGLPKHSRYVVNEFLNRYVLPSFLAIKQRRLK